MIRMLVENRVVFIMNRVSDNKGFSLVELIIVIACMAILAASIAPALIRYINRARKADDIKAAEAMGTSFQAAVVGNDVLQAYMDETVAFAVKEHNNNRYYRVVCFMDAPRNNTNAHLPNTPFTIMPLPNSNAANQALQDEMKAFLSSDNVKLQFTRDNALDTWIICTDQNGAIYVFVGAGQNTGRWYLTKDKKTTGTNRQCYMLWPEVDKAYEDLKSPRDVP